MITNWILAALAFLICSTVYAADDLKPFDYANKLHQWGTSQHVIESRLGKPDRVEYKNRQLRHDQVRSQAISLYYPELSLTVTRSQFGSGDSRRTKELLLSVRYSACRDDMKFVCFIGKTKNQVINTFGRPDKTSQDEIMYWVSYGDMGASPMRFKLKDNKVTAVYVRYFID